MNLSLEMSDLDMTNDQPTYDYTSSWQRAAEAGDTQLLNMNIEELTQCTLK